MIIKSILNYLIYGLYHFRNSIKQLIFFNAGSFDMGRPLEIYESYTRIAHTVLVGGFGFCNGVNGSINGGSVSL